MNAYPVVNLKFGRFIGAQTVSVPVFATPPIHSLTEETGSGLPIIPLAIGGLAIVFALISW